MLSFACNGEPAAEGEQCSGGLCFSGGTTGGGDGGSAGRGSGGRGGSPAAGSGGSTGGSTGGSGGSGEAGDGAGGTMEATGGSGGSGGRGGASPGGAAGSGGSGGSGGSAGVTATGGSAGMPPCEGDACGPVADLDFDFYKCNVEPILDRSCAMLGCHGSEERPLRIYARGRLRNDQDLTVAENPAAGGCLRNGVMNLAENGNGTIMCEGWTRHTELEWQKNFESARSFMRESMAPDDSELLLQPRVGGRPHVGVHPIRQGDESYTTIRRWLSGERLGSPCNPEFN